MKWSYCPWLAKMVLTLSLISSQFYIHIIQWKHQWRWHSCWFWKWFTLCTGKIRSNMVHQIKHKKGQPYQFWYLAHRLKVILNENTKLPSGARDLSFGPRLHLLLYFFIMWSVNALVSLHICAGRSEHLLPSVSLSIIISCANSKYHIFYLWPFSFWKTLNGYLYKQWRPRWNVAFYCLLW